MNLTLNDFRNVLGKVNDGNVVFTRNDGGNPTGIEKANYGRVFTHNVQNASPADNAEVRRQFALAISTASRLDRPSVSEETLNAIKARLGIAAAGQPQNGVIETPLSRREIKAILEIVDGSCEQIKVDNEILTKLNTGVNMAKRGEFEAAVNANPILSGSNKLKTVLPNTYLGFKRADIAKCVGKNLAIIKALTLDEMTWRFESSGTEMSVETAFKAALKKLMSAFGQGRMPVTRTRELFAAPPASAPFDDNENNAENYFSEHRLMPEEDLATLLTDNTVGGTGAFSKLVLSRAAGYVKNAFRKDFQDCIANNGNSAQRAHEPYDARTLGMRNELAECANDVRNIVAADPRNLARFRRDLARRIVEALRGADPATLGPAAFRDVFMACLAATVAPFSMRRMAKEFAYTSMHQDFQKDDFANAYIDDFNKRVAALPKDSGYKANVAQWQSQAFLASRDGKSAPAFDGNLKNGALENLYGQFKTAREEADPEKLREKRAARNRDAAIRTLKAIEGEEKVNGYNPQHLEENITRMYAKFYVAAHGYYSLRDEILNEIPDEEANPRVAEWIASASDDEIAFLEKFCSLRMHDIDDRCQSSYYTATGSKPEKPPLYAALRDAGPVFKEMTREGAVALGTILLNGLGRLRKDGVSVTGGRFVNMMDVGDTKENTCANCLAFVEKLEQEVSKYRGRDVTLMSQEEKAAINNTRSPEMAIHRALEGTRLLDVDGFGTLDPLKVINLLGKAGISIKDFSCSNQEKRAEACVRTLALMHFASYNNYDLDSLPEYIQRTTGKDVKEVSLSDFIRVNAIQPEKRDVVRPADAKIVDIITGKVKLSEAKLSKNDVCELRKALAEVRKPNAQPVPVNVLGKTLTLEMLSDGGLRALLKTGDKADDVKQYRFSQNAVDLSRAVDDIIVANAKDYAADVLKSVLPPLPNPAQGDSLMRAREVYAKTICAFDDKRSPVEYASVPTAQLRQLAIDAIDGKAVPAPNAVPQTFNSAEMIEMHKNLGGITLAEVDAKVKFPADAAKRTEESRRTVPPTAKEFRAIVADLFLNEDTWAFDAQVGAVPGERIRKLMLANAPELAFVFNDIPGFVQHLDAGIRDKVAELLAKLKDIPAGSLAPDEHGNVAADTMQKLAEAETLVDSLVKAYAEAMQNKVSELFAVQNLGGADKPVQYQTFAEISGISALNPNTAEGRFTLNILNGYFKKSAPVDQRAMLAAMIRNTDNASSDAKQVAELLKGAGPLLQKMLQGLPISSFNAETQLALKDMKSRLALIPAEAVKAQLLELVNSSNGEILSVEVKKVLGAATVGEALLCHVKTKDRPITGVDCVIKVLRPNIYTAVLREKAIFDEIIQETPEMKKPFEMRYKGILQEFDLTIEAENIRLGRTHYEHPNVNGRPVLEIASMDLVENVSPTTGTIVVKKAEGVTYDRYVDDIRAEAEEAVSHVEPNAIRMNGRVQRPCSSIRELLTVRRHLEYLKAFLAEKRDHISDFAHVWFENGLYGDGFMHGDLHAGNIMVSDKGATIIDFGNCIRLSTEEQDNIRNMVSKASIGFGEDAIKSFRNLLGEAGKAKLDAILADPQKAAFRKDLFGVFTKGTSADVMARIYAAINLLQREGVEIPGTVTNFFQSFSRLNDIYQTMTDEMARIDSLIDTLVLSDDALPQIGEGGPRIVTEMMKFVNSLSSNPDKEFDFTKFATGMNKFLMDEDHVLKDKGGNAIGGEDGVAEYGDIDSDAVDEVRQMVNTDRKKTIATIVPFLEWLCKQEIPNDGINFLRTDPENVSVRGIAPFYRTALENALKVYKDESIPEDSQEFADAKSAIMENLNAPLDSFAQNLGQIMDPTPQTANKTTGLAGVKESRGKPIYAVCGEVVASKLRDTGAFMGQLGTFIRDFFGRLDKVSVALRESMRFGGKFEARQAFAQETLEKGSDALEENLRLTTAKRRVLMRQMETFEWPFDGAWTETNAKEAGDVVEKVKISFPQEKWANLVEALTVNLNGLKTALGYAQGENLPPEIARLAVTYLAQIDPRAALAVKSLDEQSYNAFLASFAQNPNAAALGAAVDALRNAPGDAELIAAKPSVQAEFEVTDRNADKVEISVVGGFRLFKNLFSGDN